jgi:hypothetical protein
MNKLRFWIIAALLTVSVGVLAQTQPPLPRGIVKPPRAAPSLRGPPPAIRTPPAAIHGFDFVRVAASAWGHPYRRTSPLALPDPCVPQPNDPEAPGTEPRWGLTFNASTPANGINRITRVSICRNGGCFYMKTFNASAASEMFVGVPQVDAPDPTAATLPTLKYDLIVESSNGPPAKMSVSRTLAPLPVIAAASDATVMPAGATDTLIRTVFVGAQDIGMFTVRPTPAGGIRVPESESAITAGLAPLNVTHVTVKRTASTGLYCDVRTLSADDLTVWGSDRPARLWARSPRISGCQLSTFTPAVRGFAGLTGSACSQGFHDDSVHGKIVGPGVTGGGSGGSPMPGGACMEGTPCTPTTAQLSGCQSGFSPSGVMHCDASGRGTCRIEICHTCGTTASGANCGACHCESCSANPSDPAHWCEPNSICGVVNPADTGPKGCSGTSCMLKNGTPCGLCRPNSQCTTTLACWLPLDATGSWPGRTNEDVCGPASGSGGCEPQCDASDCGDDGCGGTCGTMGGACSVGLICLTPGDSPYGGTCTRMK